MKIYLAGPMRGYPNFNFPAFDYAAQKLREQGFEVFSPAERDRDVHGTTLEDNATGDEAVATANTGFSLRDALVDDTAYICRHADGVFLLPGWEKSTGATAERALGKALGLTIAELGRDYLNV